MTRRRISKEKRELLEELTLLLRDYNELLGIHCDKERLDNEIDYLVGRLKNDF